MESESSRFTDELNIYRSYLDRAAPRRRWSNTGRARSMQSHSKKGSTYSITERTVPELIPVLGSQPAGDVKAAFTFRQACSYPRNP